MLKRLLVLSACAAWLTAISSAQNTFPATGNVGIGTVTPTKTLSVNGSISTGGPSNGIYFRVPPAGQNNTVISPSLLLEGLLSGNGTAALPWGLNIMSAPWSWGQDPITYHGGSHLFRIAGGNTAETEVAEVNSGGILVDSGFSLTFAADGSKQTTAWTGVLCGGDYAESVDVGDDRNHYEPGDLIVVDSASPGKFLKSTEPYSTLVAGIYSTKPGVVGRRSTEAFTSKDEIPMAMVGIVPAKVSTENGPIKAGDLLVTSSTLGYAMKGTDHERMLGAVVGKSLDSLSEGTGLINVLVSLQ